MNFELCFKHKIIKCKKHVSCNSGFSQTLLPPEEAVGLKILISVTNLANGKSLIYH